MFQVGVCRERNRREVKTGTRYDRHSMNKTSIRKRLNIQIIVNCTPTHAINMINDIAIFISTMVKMVKMVNQCVYHVERCGISAMPIYNEG